MSTDQSAVVVDGGFGQSSASKILTMLNAIARMETLTFGVTDVALEMGVPKSTAHRLLKTLEDHGFVGRSGSKYRIGEGFLEIGQMAHRSEYGDLVDSAARPAAALFESSDAIAVHLAVLRGGEVFYLDKLTRPAGTRMPSRVGGSFPATCTALGKAMLAFSDSKALELVVRGPLSRVTPYSITSHQQLLRQLVAARKAGYAVEREEACPGIVCVAAPVVSGGQVVAALSTSTQSVEVAGRETYRIERLGRLVAAAARDIARQLLPA